MALLSALPFVTHARTRPSNNDKTTKIVAHRGFWNCKEAGYAKNSVAALRCAQEAGFWGSEFDVNMTEDGVLLVFHDGKVEGMTIEKHPYSDLKDIKIKNGENIPTIDQYLEQGKKHPETMLVYELKKHSSKKVEDRFVDITIEKLKEYELLDPERVMFISFSWHICKRLADKLPGFTVQYLSGNKKPGKVKAKNVNGIDYKYTVFDRRSKWIDQAHSLGMSTNTWTVNEKSAMLKMMESGVQAITTDHPLELRSLLTENGYTEVH